MTTIAYSPVPVEIEAPPKPKARNLSIDRARTFLTLVVLLHHAVIPYTYFGHTDPKYWIGFDCVVLATDSFFMAMFFFLSGLFVWPSLARKSPRSFFYDRLLRLGLPFVVAIFTIVPIAYYAISLRENPDVGFAAFWWKTITVGPWPSGPLWFVWVLLMFDLTASALYRISPRLLDPINRLSLHGFEKPAAFLLVLFGVTATIYIPARVHFGPGDWFSFGPFHVQAGRVLLYAIYFFVGAGIGAANFNRGVLSPDGRLAKGGWGWVLVAAVPYCLMWGLIGIKRELLGNPDVLPDWYEALYGLFFAGFSAAILVAILAFFLGYKRSATSILDPMRKEAYGMFLVHYPICLWLQYWMFALDLPAIVKAAIAFVLTVALSWAATAMLRTIPGATRVL